MSKSWLALPISLLTVCSIFTNFIQADAKDSLAPSNAETQTVSKLKGWKTEAFEQLVRALRGSIDENFVRNVARDIPLDGIARQIDFAQVAASTRNQVTRLKVLKKPQVSNGNLDLIMSQLFRNQSCNGIVSCNIIAQKNLGIQQSYEISLAQETLSQLADLINTKQLNSQDDYQARLVANDLYYALSL
jgi:hypothetical protein